MKNFISILVIIVCISGVGGKMLNDLREEILVIKKEVLTLQQEYSEIPGQVDALTDGVILLERSDQEQIEAILGLIKNNYRTSKRVDTLGQNVLDISELLIK